MDAGFLVSGLEEMEKYKADEVALIEKALGIELSVKKVGYLDGFYIRPMNPSLATTELDHMAYLESYSEGAAARREINSKYKGGRK